MLFNTYFPVNYCEAALTQSVLFKVFYKWMWLDFLMHLFKVFVFDVLLQGWAIIRTFRPGLRSWRSSLRSCSREPSSTRWQRPRWPIALRGLWNLSQWWGIRGSYPSPWRWPLWSLVLNGWVLYVNYMIFVFLLLYGARWVMNWFSYNCTILYRHNSNDVFQNTICNILFFLFCFFIHIFINFEM